MQLKDLDLKYPIFQGGMAHIATPEFAAAVSNAGGLGILGTGAMTAAGAKAAIEQLQRLTDKPFGVNIMLMNPQAADIVDAVSQLKPAVVTLGAGNSGPYIRKLKEAGILVIPVVSNVALAKRLERAGADAVIAEGTESGGHVGTATTLALVPQMKDALGIPVIAAGGIGDGRGMAAAFCLGARAVQVGTCLLASEECPVHQRYKEAVIRAKDSSTVVTGTLHNTPVRIMRNALSREYLSLEKAAANREVMERLTLGAFGRAVYDGDMESGSVMMGQIAGLVKKTETVEEILERMDSQCRQILGRSQYPGTETSCAAAGQ